MLSRDAKMYLQSNANDECNLESMESATDAPIRLSGVRMGIKRIVIEWAQRIYVVETDRTVPKKRNRDADR
jgi:hypothetical protein